MLHMVDCQTSPETQMFDGFEVLIVGSKVFTTNTIYTQMLHIGRESLHVTCPFECGLQVHLVT